MERKYNIVLSIFVALFIGTVIFMGCSKSKDNEKSEGKSTETTSKDTQKDSTTDSVMMGKKIAQNVENIEGVEKATVFIKESTALVGVTLKDGANELSEDMKAKIEEKVKETSSDIRKVASTADKELFQKLDKMANDFMNGKTLEELKKDLQEILQQLGA